MYMKYWALDAEWRSECPLRIYEMLSTGIRH